MLELVALAVRAPVVSARLGAPMGWLAYLARPATAAAARQRRAGRRVCEAERRASVAEAGRMVAELPRLWLRPPARPGRPGALGR
jgi:KDO2-lipid IV(A) lauroyltransferase